MKIAFLLGSPDISGGTYVIFEHSVRLRRFGHDVTILTEETVPSSRYAWHSTAGELRWLTLEQAGKEQFDIVLATWWQSPFLLKEVASTHAVYFVQSIETRFFEAPDPADYDARDHAVWQDLCEKTYSIALPMITEARWIQGYLHDNYHANPFLVRNGIRKDVYTPTGATAAGQEEGKLRVLVEGPVDVSYKNVPASIRLAGEAGVDEVWLLTSSDITDFPGADRVFSRIPIHETPEIYRSCDVLLKLSYVEGMFGPPLEMFHCGGTAIVYKVTGYDEYIVHDHNSFVVDRDDERSVVEYLQRLKNDPETLLRLKEGAANTAEQWPDWDQCSRDFEQALLTIASGPPTSREYLARFTEALFKEAKSKVKARILDTFQEREENFQKQESLTRDNFVEFYWHCSENFTQQDCKWRHYRSDTWFTCAFDVGITGFPFWMKVNPSVWIGIISIAEITVINTTTQIELMSFREPDDFATLLLSGTACWLDEARRNIIFSYGDDPMFVLPGIEADKAALGDRLRLEIRLYETGVRQFFYGKTVGFPEMDHPGSSEGCMESLTWKQRILNKLR